MKVPGVTNASYLICSLLIVFALASTAMAQETTGNIAGQVTDQNGGTISGVQTNTTFGVITGTRDPRTIQFGLKLNF
ncbi:MAG: hypothetical protein ABI698_10875 [bacterium]